MKLKKTTPDGTFTVTIRSVFTDPDEDVPDGSLEQLVQLLEQTADLFRVAPAPTTPRVRIQIVEALPNYRLRLGLSDGRTVERDLSDLVPGPEASPTNVFLPWRDPAYFARVFLPAEAWPTATWPNGVDLDPDVLIWGVDADGHLLAPPESDEALDARIAATQEAIESARGTLRILEAEYETLRRQREARTSQHDAMNGARNEGPTPSQTPQNR